MVPRNGADKWLLVSSLFFDDSRLGAGAQCNGGRGRLEVRGNKQRKNKTKQKTPAKEMQGVSDGVTEVASVKGDHHLLPAAPLIILDAISLKQILFNFIVPDQAMQFLLAGHFLAFIRLSQ